jgi:hypothetical protein
MSKGLIAALSVLCIVGVAGAEEMVGQSGLPYPGPEIRPEMLYQGDLIPELGIGCSNPTGNSGGPNDVAVCVIASLAPPFCITSHFFNVYTSSIYVNELNFAVWTGVGPPGTQIALVGGMPWTVGSHTVAISPPVPVPTAFFCFGQNQPQSDAGMRWGLDTNSGSSVASYIRAPGCGANAWTRMDAIGYPGNWCMSVSTDAGSPVELQSWGAIKGEYR